VSADDRRRDTRYPSTLRCWIRGEARTVFVTLRDLSAGGLGIRAPTTFRRGDRAEVLLQDPHHVHTLRASGEIAWSHPDPDHPEHAGTGLRFVEILEGRELLPQVPED
jgi:Tfp pilus assembly protein PilZ